MTVAGSVIVDVMRYLLTQGVNAESVCREAGVDPGVVYALDREISGEETATFWAAAAKAARDPTLGLHVGEATLLSTLGVAGYAIMKSDTFGEALRKATTYTGLVNRGVEFEVRREGPWATLACTVSEGLQVEARDTPWRPSWARPRRSSTASWARASTWGPSRSSTTRRSRPGSTNESSASFRAFPRTATGCCFPAATWTSPCALPTQRPTRGRSAPSRGPRPRISPSTHWAARTWPGPGSSSSISFVVVVPPSRIWRRGSASPSQRCGGTCAERAPRSRSCSTRHAGSWRSAYLASEDVTLHQMAFLLGFPDEAAFARAFEKWTGKAPDGYREASAGSA